MGKYIKPEGRIDGVSLILVLMVWCFEEMSQLGEGGAGHCGQCVLHVSPLGSINSSVSNLTQILASFYHFWLGDKVHITFNTRKILCQLYRKS